MHDDAPADQDLSGSAAIPPSGAPELRSLLSLAVAAVVIAALYFAQDVLIPIILAVLLSFVLSPVVTALGRAGLSRAPSVIVTVLMTFGVVALAATMLASQASTLAADAPRYAQTIEQKLQGIELFATSRIGAVTRLFGAAAENEPPAVAGAPPPALARRPAEARALAESASERRPLPVELVRSSTSPLATLRSVLAPVLGPLETTVIVLVIAIFILMEREDLRDRFIRIVGSNDLNRTTAAMDDAARRLSRYFLSQLAVNGMFGLVIGIGLWAFGVPSPALWGVLAGMLRFVPYIGSFLAAVPPIALGAASDPGWLRAAEVAMLFIVVEPLTGYVVEPLLYGHSTGLAPVSVIVAAVFWTWIWGPIGLILSTPLTLCLVVMGRHAKSLEFFDVLLGDRPALAPVENLYQRLLADNPDEVLDKAEALLADRTLLEYYDGVMLEGLKLAADDQARGNIPPQRAAAMAHSLLQVIDDLGDHVDALEDRQKTNDDRLRSARVASPIAADSRLPGGTVACIAGRGSFDDAVSAMLCQLLTREGVPTRRIRHELVSRDRISQLDLSGVSIVVLSYIELRDATSHLRYLVKRLRQHAPNARVIVGLWPPGDAGAQASADAEARRGAIGADEYVGSLRETLVSILGASRVPEPAAPHDEEPADLHPVGKG